MRIDPTLCRTCQGSGVCPRVPGGAGPVLPPFPRSQCTFSGLVFRISCLGSLPQSRVSLSGRWGLILLWARGFRAGQQPNLPKSPTVPRALLIQCPRHATHQAVSPPGLPSTCLHLWGGSIWGSRLPCCEEDQVSGHGRTTWGGPPGDSQRIPAEAPDNVRQRGAQHRICVNKCLFLEVSG